MMLERVHYLCIQALPMPQHVRTTGFVAIFDHYYNFLSKDVALVDEVTPPAHVHSGRPTPLKSMESEDSLSAKCSTLLAKYIAIFVYYMETTLDESRVQSADGISRQLPCMKTF